MVEREMQELIWEHPERFFNEPLKQFAWEASSAEVGRADLVFEDRHGRLLIIEVKRGKLPRGAIDQLHDYFGMMKQKYPDRAVEMMVVAWVIPSERKLACEHYDIECREFSERFFRQIAAEYGYLFVSESQPSDKMPQRSNSSYGVDRTTPASEVIDKAGMREEKAVRDQAEISDKLRQDETQKVAASPEPLAMERAVRDTLPSAQEVLPPGLPMALAVLQLLANDLERSPKEIQERLKIQFHFAPSELIQKHESGTTVFHNNVALALANLQGAPHRGPKAIEKVKKHKEDVYRITEYGKSLLKRNPSDLTIRDL